MSAFSEFSLIIFTYNEGKSLAKVIESSFTFMEGVASVFEILIVDDGSNDNTSNILEKYINNQNIRIIKHPKNLGIGNALKTGYKNSRYKYVCAIPGDGQFDINELSLIPEFTEEFFYSFYRKNKNYNAYRQLLTFINYKFNSYFLNLKLKDVNWIKVYHNYTLKKIDLVLTSSLIESEICGKLIKMNIKGIEVPSEYLERKYGVPKGGNIKTLTKALIEVFKLWRLIIKFKK
jgi:glycosyltransferase involved in cell wall biosynthesis